DRLFGVAPMTVLSRSRVLLSQAKTSTEGRISLGHETRARIEPWCPSRAACAAWPIAFADWSALNAALLNRASPAATAAGLQREPVLLMPSSHGPVIFDEVSQEHVWPVCDREGRWTALTLAHDPGDAMPAARLARYAAQSAISLVMAFPGQDRRGLPLTPFALVAETLAGKKPGFSHLQVGWAGLSLLHLGSLPLVGLPPPEPE